MTALRRETRATTDSTEDNNHIPKPQPNDVNNEATLLPKLIIRPIKKPDEEATAIIATRTKTTTSTLVVENDVEVKPARRLRYLNTHIFIDNGKQPKKASEL